MRPTSLREYPEIVQGNVIKQSMPVNQGETGNKQTLSL